MNFSLFEGYHQEIVIIKMLLYFYQVSEQKVYENLNYQSRFFNVLAIYLETEENILCKIYAPIDK